jgi:glucokinase
MTLVPVLEVGGTHAFAALVDPASWTVLPEPVAEARLHGDASADVLLDALASCVGAVGSGPLLAVAIPGPFDYAAGVGRFHGVGKFESLNGVDVGAELAARLSPAPERLAFVNDAAAVGLGEWLCGAGRAFDRVVVVTLGTGVGSAFVDAGTVVTRGPSVPPDGYVYRLEVGGVPLEDVVSRRAILARFQDAGGDRALDVREIAQRATEADPVAHDAFTGPIEALGTALSPWLARFDAQVLVVGGAMSESWALVEPALRRGLRAAGDETQDVPISRGSDARTAGAVGAVWHAVGELTARPSGAEGGGR